MLQYLPLNSDKAMSILFT